MRRYGSDYSEVDELGYTCSSALLHREDGTVTVQAVLRRDGCDLDTYESTILVKEIACREASIIENPENWAFYFPDQVMRDQQDYEIIAVRKRRELKPELDRLICKMIWHAGQIARCSEGIKHSRLEGNADYEEGYRRELEQDAAHTAATHLAYRITKQALEQWTLGRFLPVGSFIGNPYGEYNAENDAEYAYSERNAA